MQRDEPPAHSLHVRHHQRILGGVNVGREDNQTFSRVLVEDGLQIGKLAAAGAAERVPEIQQHDLAAVIGQRDFPFAAEARGFERGGRLGICLQQLPQVPGGLGFVAVERRAVAGKGGFDRVRGGLPHPLEQGIVGLLRLARRGFGGGLRQVVRVRILQARQLQVRQQVRGIGRFSGCRHLLRAHQRVGIGRACFPILRGGPGGAHLAGQRERFAGFGLRVEFEQRGHPAVAPAEPRRRETRLQHFVAADRLLAVGRIEGQPVKRLRAALIVREALCHFQGPGTVLFRVAVIERHGVVEDPRRIFRCGFGRQPQVFLALFPLAARLRHQRQHVVGLRALRVDLKRPPRVLFCLAVIVVQHQIGQAREEDRLLRELDAPRQVELLLFGPRRHALQLVVGFRGSGVALDGLFQRGERSGVVLGCDRSLGFLELHLGCGLPRECGGAVHRNRQGGHPTQCQVHGFSISSSIPISACSSEGPRPVRKRRTVPFRSTTTISGMACTP